MKPKDVGHGMAAIRKEPKGLRVLPGEERQKQVTGLEQWNG